MAQINVRVDDEVKANAEKVLKQLGLPMSVAVNIYLLNPTPKPEKLSTRFSA